MTICRLYISIFIRSYYNIRTKLFYYYIYIHIQIIIISTKVISNKQVIRYVRIIRSVIGTFIHSFEGTKVFFISYEGTSYFY